MSYEVGTRIDLKRLAGKQEAEPVMAVETPTTLYQVGTRLIFRTINKEMKAVRRIRVVYV